MSASAAVWIGIATVVATTLGVIVNYIDGRYRRRCERADAVRKERENARDLGLEDASRRSLDSSR
jgi:hypothetical protein